MEKINLGLGRGRFGRQQDPRFKPSVYQLEHEELIRQRIMKSQYRNVFIPMVVVKHENVQVENLISSQDDGANKENENLKQAPICVKHHTEIALGSAAREPEIEVPPPTDVNLSQQPKWLTIEQIVALRSTVNLQNVPSNFDHTLGVCRCSSSSLLDRQKASNSAKQHSEIALGSAAREAPPPPPTNGSQPNRITREQILTLRSQPKRLTREQILALRSQPNRLTREQILALRSRASFQNLPSNFNHKLGICRCRKYYRTK